MTLEELVQRALDSQQHAYAPYSNFPVGAALLAADGQVFSGCNVENGSFGLTCCAERVALYSAIATGQREFAQLAIASKGGVVPCGACRQTLSEFNPALPIVLVDSETGSKKETTLAELFPAPFSLAEKD
jgi:cytidine deaminase